MKNNLLKVALIVIAIVSFNLSSLDSKAQSQAPFRGYVYLQPNVGVLQYFGEFNKFDYHNKKASLGYGAVLGWQFHRVLGIRAQYVGGTVKSEKDAWDNLGGRKMETKMNEIGGQLTLNVNELFNYNPDRFLNVYLFGGAAYIMEKTTLSVLPAGTAINGQTDVKNNGLSFPFGGGLAFRLGYNVDLNLEYGHRILARDTEFDLTGSEGKMKRDQYSYISGGLTFKFRAKDTDGDGVPDKEDACPDVAGKVELQGCPDRDNDGIADKDDACPDVAGLAQFQGCPDTDGDGIPDKDDACPTEAGIASLNGCPDRDGDGVADKDDKCPDVPGVKALAGCPDRDGDGIADAEDQCPDVAGLAKFNGCPDTDGDGIPDNLDKCPNVPGTYANNGCPEEAKKDEYFKVVYFNFDKSVVIAKYTKDLDEVAKYLKENKTMNVSVEGHADSKGSDDYNMRLSEKRANYVKNYLTKKGVEKSRVTTAFFGESKPADTNDTDAGRANNRRVEIKGNK